MNVSSSEALQIINEDGKADQYVLKLELIHYFPWMYDTPKEAPSQKQKRKRTFHDHDTHLLALVLVLSVSPNCSQCNPLLCSGIALSILSGRKSYRHIYRSI